MRKAVVAGTFYPKNKTELKEQLKKFFSNSSTQTKKTNAVIAPHAGYIYSGKTAAKSYSFLEKAETFVLIGPNHTGLGEEISIYPEGKWATPLGEIEIDAVLAKDIAKKIPEAELEEEAHLEEHSIEVQLPFLQYLFGGKFKIVPICIATDERQALKGLAEAIFEAEKKEKRKISIIASSDFSHFVPEENARKKDLSAIEKIARLETDGFEKEVEEKALSICGHAPIAVVMEYCKLKGYKKARLLEYTTSAEVTGEKESVVGYAAIVFE